MSITRRKRKKGSWGNSSNNYPQPRKVYPSDDKYIPHINAVSILALIAGFAFLALAIYFSFN